MKGNSITTLSNEEIKRTDYLQIENVEPDTSSCNYLFDDAIQPRRGADNINFWFYQVCPLKNKKGIFLCTPAINGGPYSAANLSAGYHQRMGGQRALSFRFPTCRLFCACNITQANKRVERKFSEILERITYLFLLKEKRTDSCGLSLGLSLDVLIYNKV